MGTPVTVADLQAAGGSYNQFNTFNTTGGIVHLIQSINTLNAAFGLARGSVHTGTVRDNYERTFLPATSVDPRVILDIGTLARKGLSLTLREPIGLYIAG